MPQLDGLILFDQVFLTTIFFLIFYSLILFVLFPAIISKILARKKITSGFLLKTKYFGYLFFFEKKKIINLKLKKNNLKLFF